MKNSFLPALNERKKRNTVRETETSTKKNIANSVVDSENDKEGENFNHLDIDSFSVQNSYGFRSKNPENMSKTEKELIE